MVPLWCRKTAVKLQTMLSRPDQPKRNPLFHLCREPDLLKVADTFPRTERCSSSDSVKASSGEVSPYDNNSPLLSDGPLYEYPADSDAFADASPVFSPPRQHDEHSGGTSPSLSTDKGDGNGLFKYKKTVYKVKSRILNDQFSLHCTLSFPPRQRQTLSLVLLIPKRFTHVSV